MSKDGAWSYDSLSVVFKGVGKDNSQSIVSHGRRATGLTNHTFIGVGLKGPRGTRALTNTRPI